MEPKNTLEFPSNSPFYRQKGPIPQGLKPGKSQSFNVGAKAPTPVALACDQLKRAGRAAAPEDAHNLHGRIVEVIDREDS